MVNTFNRRALYHDNDPTLGIDTFAPDFWRLVGQPLESSPPSRPDQQPPAVPPRPNEETPEDRSRREMYGRLRTHPLYKGEPRTAQVLPPAREGEILSVQRPDPKESAMIVKNIKWFAPFEVVLP